MGVWGLGPSGGPGGRAPGLTPPPANGLHGHVNPPLRLALELHVPIDDGEDRVIAAEADVGARLPAGAALAEDDVAGDDGLAARLLDAEAPAFGIAAVAGRAASFFMCHGVVSFRLRR